MKVVHVSRSSSMGGAARAAFRLHRAVGKQGVESQFLAKHNPADYPEVIGAGDKKTQRKHLRRVRAANRLMRLVAGHSVDYRSISAFGSDVSGDLRALAPDVTHLHWVNAEMMSIGDIGRLAGPVVWTLHDMWAFCGAAHYAQERRWVAGYGRANRPTHLRGFDLDAWVWRRKKRHLTRPFHIVTPSNWLAKCVSESNLMRDWPIEVCPNPLDVDIWTPTPKRAARHQLGLPPDRAYMVFGAMDADKSNIKGFDLLSDALSQLDGQGEPLEALIFGNSSPLPSHLHGIPVRGFGRIEDDAKLALIYCAADVAVVPSRMDNLPQTATEALACGTPVAAFDIGGLSDIVTPNVTGLLAPAFDTGALAGAITQLMREGLQHQRSDAGQNGDLSKMSHDARAFTLGTYAPDIVAKRYIEIYQRAHEAFHSSPPK